MENQVVSKGSYFTLLGCGALVFWSVYAWAISELMINLPVFQTLFIMFAVSFVGMIIRIAITKRWHVLKQPLFIWVVGIVGVCGSDLAYISAVKYAPPAHVDFIDYLWPFLVILFSSFLPKEKFTLQHTIAGCLGLLGVLLLITGGHGVTGLQPSYFMGYILAFTAAIIWSLYTIINRWRAETPFEMIGMYCGMGALIALLLHLHFETWITPSLKEGSLVLLLGLFSGMAYLLWNYGTQKGNLKLLGVLAYFTPMMSMGLLVLSGKEPMSYALIGSCLLVVLGVIVGSLNWTRIKAKI